MTEETDDAFNRFFHAKKFGEGRIDPNGPVHKDAAQPLILGGVQELGIADRMQDPFGGARVGLGIRAAQIKIRGKRHLRRLPLSVGLCEVSENVTLFHRHTIRRLEPKPDYRCV